ncbi:VOC family protein [Spirillospora sp. CA-294931]|uniref:VOC family protein n=1 Tax=Spirillospora sp. CA-294931 TaxID=3240042 RepID=UPI003D8D122B
MELRMNTIDIVVADLEASVAFYRRLGVEFKVDAAFPDHAGADLPGGLHLMLDTEPFRASTTPGWSKPSGGPRVFLAFQAPTPAGVDSTYAELIEAGYQGIKEPWDAYWGMRYATVADPDGNGVDLYCPLPAN